MEPVPEQPSEYTPDTASERLVHADAPPAADSESFIIPVKVNSSRLAEADYHGPGAAAAGSTNAASTDTAHPATLDAPFNGALQPANNPAINQGSLLDDVSVSMPDDPLPEPPKPVSRQRLISLGLVSIGILAALILGVRIELAKSHDQEARIASPSAQLKPQQLPTASLSKQLGTISTVASDNQVTVNGSLVLAPSVQPSNPLPGQLYYSQTAHQMQYYNGTGYVLLQGGVTNNYYSNSTVNNTYNTSNVTNVTDVTNISGGGTTLSGTPGALAMFGADGSSLADSLVTQAGTTLNAGTIGTTTVSVGSGTGTSAAKLQGGTGGASLLTGAATGASGSITIQSGDSSTTSSGNVTVDTGVNAVVGTVVENHTFESGTEGQGDGFGFLDTYASSTAQAHGGTHSLAVTSGNGQYGGGGNPSWWAADPTPYSTPVVPGDNYQFSAWVRADTSARTVDCDVFWSSTGYGGGGLVEDDQWCSTTDSAATWKHVSGTLTAPPGAYSLGLGFTGYSTPAGEVHYLDDVTVTDVSSSPTVSQLNLGADNAQQITIGNSGATAVTTIFGHGLTLNGGQSAVTVTGGSIGLTGKSSVSLTAGSGSGITARVTANTTAAFQVQGAAGNSLLNVDSVNSAISLGVSPAQLGSTAVGANGNSGGQNGLMFGKIVTGGDTTSSSVSVYFRSGDSSPNNKFQVALYSDNGGKPGALITSTGDNVIAAPGWNTVPLTTALTASTTYWVGVTENGSFNNADNVAFDTGGAGYAFWNPGVVVNGTTVAYGAWPSTFVGGPAANFANSNTLSIYLNTSSSSSYAIVTDNNGRVGIGTSTPSSTAQLYVASPSVYGYAAFLQGETTINSRNNQAFNVLDGVGNSIVSVDALDSRTYINGNSGTGLQGSLNVFSNGRHENILNLYGEGTTEVSVTDGGAATFKNGIDSTSAFQIKNAAGSATLFNIDTTNSSASLGVGVGAGTTSLQGGTGGVSIATGSTTGSSGGITIQSGGSSTTSAGNVSFDTGSSTVDGTVIETDGFEGGTDDFGAWTGDNTTTAQDCTEDHTGSCSLAVSSDNGGAALEHGGDYGSAVTPGHSYVFSVWVKADGADNLGDVASIYGTAIWGTTGGWQYDDSASTQATTTGWTFIQWTGIAPAGSQYVAFVLGGPNNGATVYFDDVTATDLSSSATTAMVSLGSTNAQALTLGNLNELGATNIFGGSNINLNSGVSNINLTGGMVTVKPYQDDSVAAFQIQNTNGDALLSADTVNMQITIANLVVTGNITIDGHVVTGGVTPNIAAGSAACTAPTVAVAGTDTSGTVTVTTGTGCSGGGTLATISFASAYADPPNVTLTPANGAAASLQYFNGNATENDFTVDTNNAPSDAVTYKWHYWVAQ